MTAIAHRYEFVYLFDVTNGNPNGDPDAGNLPRLDPETNRGLVTDVALKRKIRNFVTLDKEGGSGYGIYMQEKAVLNRQHREAYKALNLEPIEKKLPKEEKKAREITVWMCANFFDVRTFGAVMRTKVNSGQVRGPVQIAFATSIEPVLPLEVAITRVAVTSEEDAEKKDSEMGRKHILPHGLYRAHGFISARLAERTGFSDDDLQLLWNSLINMFEHDRSAARGEKDKVGVVDAWQASRSAKTSHDPVREAQSDAVLGLISLGYKQGEAQKAVNEIAKQPGFDPASSADKIIREALRSMN